MGFLLHVLDFVLLSLQTIFYRSWPQHPEGGAGLSQSCVQFAFVVLCDTVLTLSKAQWLLYIPKKRYAHKFYVLPTQCICVWFLCIAKQTAIIIKTGRVSQTQLVNILCQGALFT
jgi:hypothetical protein